MTNHYKIKKINCKLSVGTLLEDRDIIKRNKIVIAGLFYMIKRIKRFITGNFGKSVDVKNTYYTELLETFDSGDCVICKLLEVSVLKYLENLLHEFTMDPTSRKEIREAFGYCKKHIEQLIEVTKSTNQRLSAAIVAEDLADYFLKHSKQLSKGGIQAGSGMFKTRKICPICKYYNKHEKMYVSEFAKGTEKEEFLEKFELDPGICIEHLIQVSKSLKSRATLKRLLKPQIKAIKKIDLDLNNFIKKFDHRSSEGITDDEASAWFRMYERINSK
jgi:hypothetical protein